MWDLDAKLLSAFKCSQSSVQISRASLEISACKIPEVVSVRVPGICCLKGECNHTETLACITRRRSFLPHLYHHWFVILVTPAVREGLCVPSQPWSLILFSALQLLSALSGDLEVSKEEGKEIDHVSQRLLLVLTSDY